MRISDWSSDVCSSDLLCFPTDRAAYGRLCRLLTLGKRRAEKGNCLFSFEEIIEHGAGQVFVLLPPENESIETESALLRLAAAFPNNVFLGAGALYQGDDHRRLAALARLAQEVGVGLAAYNDLRMHAASRQPLLDTATCIREHCTIDPAGSRLEANAERPLKNPAEVRTEEQ